MTWALVSVDDGSILLRAETKAELNRKRLEKFTTLSNDRIDRSPYCCDVVCKMIDLGEEESYSLFDKDGNFVTNKTASDLAVHLDISVDLVRSVAVNKYFRSGTYKDCYLIKE